MEDCIFCKIVRREIPSRIVWEDEDTLAFYDISPAVRHHTLVIPKRHATDIFDISDEDLQKTMATVKKLSNLYKERLGVNDVQILNCSGKAAQQSVFHIHFHILPRFEGDLTDQVFHRHPDYVEDYPEVYRKLHGQDSPAI